MGLDRMIVVSLTPIHSASSPLLVPVWIHVLGGGGGGGGQFSVAEEWLTKSPSGETMSLYILSFFKFQDMQHCTQQLISITIKVSIILYAAHVVIIICGINYPGFYQTPDTRGFYPDPGHKRILPRPRTQEDFTQTLVHNSWLTSSIIYTPSRPNI